MYILDVLQDRSSPVSLFRLEAARSEQNPWVDEIKDDLCQVLNQQKQLVVIFEFESQRHHGQLEDAILEAVFNGSLKFSIGRRILTGMFGLGAKFSGDNLDEQMKLAMVRLWLKYH